MISPSFEEYCKAVSQHHVPCRFPRLTGFTKRPCLGEKVCSRSPLLADIPNFLDSFDEVFLHVKAAWSIILASFTGNTSIGLLHMGWKGEGGGNDLASWMLSHSNLDLDTFQSVASLVDHFRDPQSPGESPSWPTPEVQHASGGLRLLGNSVLVIGNPPSEEYETMADLFDICLRFARDESRQQMFVELSARSGLLEECHVENVLQTLCTTFRNILLDSKQPISTLDILSEGDQAQISTWNHQMPDLIQNSVSALFQCTARQYAEDPAISSWDGDMSYRQLQANSSALANYLSRQGAGPGDFVAICLNKSKWVPVAMLAVVEAGAAFYTMDPAQPTSRLESMLHAAKSRIVLTDENQKERFQGIDIIAMTGIPEICKPELQLQTTPVPSRDCAGADDPAFMIFTSGSTGVPKGVLHTHGAAAGQIQTKPGSGYGPGCRLLQFASQAYGASIWEVLKPLVSGACLCIPSEQDRLNDIATFIRSHRVTRSFLTPSYLKTLSPEDVPSVKILSLGGEQLPPDLVEKWARRVQLVETYGMSEGPKIHTNISHTGLKLRSHQVISGAAWLVAPLDPHRLVPIGAVGLLCFEGNTLFKEYLDAPTKTSDCFLRNPRWAEKMLKRPLAPIFKTGDLARLTGDGVVQILGRGDFSMVKINGQRLDVGDVETHIAKCIPRGTTAVVEAIQPLDGGGQSVLVCFMAFIGNQDPKETMPAIRDRVRRELEGDLPAYMLPSAFLPLEKIPLNASFKLDRQQLRRIGSKLSMKELFAQDGATGKVETKTPPESPMECQLQSLWAHILKLEASDIGREDNFLILGGNSLAAIKLSALAREHKIQLSTQALLKNPTLKGMALVASKEIADGSTVPLSASKTRPSSSLAITDQIRHAVGNYQIEDILESTDFQAWAVFTGTLKSRGWHNYINFDFHGEVDVPRLIQACRRLLDCHKIFRSVFVVFQQCTNQVVIKNYPLIFETYVCDADQTIQDATDAYIRNDIQAPWSLGDPITKFELIQTLQTTSSTQSRLIMRASHSQYDVDCMPMIRRALETAYAGPLASEYDFGDFVNRINLNQAESERFWVQQLGDSKVTKAVSYPGPGYARYLINDQVELEIKAPKLQHYGLTPAVIASAAWGFVLSAFSHEPDVVFANVSRGRHLPLDNVENILGPCVALVPVRVRIRESDTILEYLRTVQDYMLECLPHENFGFQRIIDRCTSWPSASRFNFLLNTIDLTGAQRSGNMGGNLTYEFSQYEPYVNKSDLYLVTKQNHDQIKVELRFCESVLAKVQASIIINAFARVVEQMISSVTESMLTLKEAVATDAAEFPLQDHSWKYVQPEEAAIVADTKSEIRDKVLLVWKAVLGGELGEISDRTPFYEIWTATICASAMALEYRKSGLDISVEEVLENPTIHSQFLFLARKSCS